MSHSGRLLGREAELSRVLSLLDSGMTVGGRFVLLTGEPGIGKTRLAHEVLRHWLPGQARVVAGRCFEQYMHVPFFPISEALAAALASAPGPLEAGALRRWPELSNLMPGSGNAIARPEDGAAQLQVFQAVAAFLRELSSIDPLLVFLDDLHWADVTSLALCVYLGRYLHGAPIAFLATYRDVELGRQHPLEETLRELTRERVLDQVHLRRLTPEDTAALAVERLQAQPVSDEFVSLVYRHSEGNPFFTEELVDAFLEQSAVSERHAKSLTGSLSEIDIPHSIRSAVGQRVSRLEPPTQDLLQLASVIGPEFDLELLQQSSGLDESQLLKNLDAALRIGLLEERHTAARDTYAFTHVLIQQTLYHELLRHRARRLHLRAGEALERLNRSDFASIGQLARHFDMAGDHERTIRYAIAAGNQAAARYAHAEAVSNYDVALDLLEEHGEELRAAQLRSRLAAELYDLNRVESALAAYRTALGIFERYADGQGEARAHHGIGYVQLGRYEVGNAIVHFDKALQAWPADSEDPELAELFLDSARARIFSSDAATAGRYAERGFALAERLGNPATLARALCEVAQSRTWQDPKPTSCMPLLERAAEVARSARAWRVLHRVHLLEALAYTMAGELESALAARQRALAAAQSSGEIERVAFVHYTIAHANLALGDWGVRTSSDLEQHRPAVPVARPPWVPKAPDGSRHNRYRCWVLPPIRARSTRPNLGAFHFGRAAMILLDYELHRPYVQQRMSDANTHRMARQYAELRNSSVLLRLAASSQSTEH